MLRSSRLCTFLLLLEDAQAEVLDFGIVVSMRSSAFSKGEAGTRVERRNEEAFGAEVSGGTKRGPESKDETKRGPQLG